MVIFNELKRNVELILGNIQKPVVPTMPTSGRCTMTRARRRPSLTYGCRVTGVFPQINVFSDY